MTVGHTQQNQHRPDGNAVPEGSVSKRSFHGGSNGRRHHLTSSAKSIRSVVIRQRRICRNEECVAQKALLPLPSDSNALLLIGRGASDCSAVLLGGPLCGPVLFDSLPEPLEGCWAHLLLSSRSGAPTLLSRRRASILRNRCAAPRPEVPAIAPL